MVLAVTIPLLNLKLNNQNTDPGLKTNEKILLLSISVFE